MGMLGKSPYNLYTHYVHIVQGSVERVTDN